MCQEAIALLASRALAGSSQETRNLEFDARPRAALVVAGGLHAALDHLFIPRHHKLSKTCDRHGGTL